MLLIKYASLSCVVKLGSPWDPVDVRFPSWSSVAVGDSLSNPFWRRNGSMLGS